MVTTYTKGIYSSDGTEPATLSPCNHEERDYKALLHCENMSKAGVSQAMIFILDTNVAVIDTWVKSTWAMDWIWKNRKYIPIHEIV